MEGRKRSRKNTRQEWKRRVSSALAVVLTAAMVLNTPLSIDGLGGLHISNAFASGSNADRKEEIWATASNAKYKRGESQEVDIYVIAEDNEAVPDNSTFLTLYLRNNTGQMITEGSLTFKGNHIGQKDGYFQDMGMSGTDFPAIVVEGEERETSQEGQIAQEEPSGEGMIYQEPEMEDQNQETVLLPEEEAQPDIENLPDDLETEESEEIQDDEDEDENEAYELTGIDLQPGEMREIQFEFYTDEDEDSTKAYVEFTFRGDKEDGNRVKSDSKFYYSIGLPFVDLSLEEGTKIESGVSNDMEIWMNEPTWVDENLEERIEAQEEKEAEEEYEALEEAEEEDEVIASGSNAEKNKDQSLTEGKGAGQETASPSDADREEISQEQKDQEKINQYTQEAMKISESKVSYEIEVYGVEFERFSPRKAEEAEGLGWISCVYEVANHTEPGLYYGKVRANGRWNNEKFTSEQGFFFEVTGEGRTGQEYTAELNNMTVHAYAEEGVLPENVQLKVTELSETNAETAEQFQKAVDALNQEGTAYDGMMAVDITFVDENGEEIEPEGEVQVSIEMKEGALPEGVDLSTVEVHHLKEVDEETVEVEAVADGADKTDGTVRSAEEIVTELEEAEASQEEIQAAVSEDAAAVAEFSVASFSTFTITWGNRWDGNSVTVHYVDTNGNEIFGRQTETVYPENDKWVRLADYASTIKYYNYQGARLNNINGIEATHVKYMDNGRNKWRYYNDEKNQPSDNETGTHWSGNSKNIYLVYKLEVQLSTADTISHTDKGVHMFMFNYDSSAFSRDEGGYGNGTTKVGLAGETTNSDTGWPSLLNRDGKLEQDELSFSNYFGGTESAFIINDTDLNNEGQSVDNLFLKAYYDVNGEFYFNSAEYFATLKDEDGDLTDSFTVYNQLGTPRNDDRFYFQRGNFLPYNRLDLTNVANYNRYSDTGEALTPDDERYGEPIFKTNHLGSGYKDGVDYYFGMYTWAQFYQPENGMVERNDGTGSDRMRFEFTGDDDMWVYIDGVLVLDIGGIHDAQSGYIDFSTGKVNWTITPNKTENSIPVPNDEVIWYNGGNESSSDRPITLKEIFEDAHRYNSTTWKGDTFADGSYHTIQIFYMERGDGASNLKIRFNLKTIPDGEVSVRKNVENYYGPQIGNVDYTMKITVNDEPYVGESYTLFEQEGEGTTDENGEFKLKHDQTAVFSDLEVGDEVKVEEVRIGDLPDGVEIEGAYDITYTVTDSSGAIIGDGENQEGPVEAEMPAYGSITVEVTNTATFTRPIKLVKNFSGTEGNIAPEGFQATYTLYEAGENGELKGKIGSVRYSDMTPNGDDSSSYVFWLETGKYYTIIETFNGEGDNNGSTESLSYQKYNITTNDPAEGLEAEDGIVYLETDDALEGDLVDTITLTNVYGEPTVSLTIIKNIYGLSETQAAELIQRDTGLLFDIEGFTVDDYLINDEVGVDPGEHQVWNDAGGYSIAVKDTVVYYPGSEGAEGTWSPSEIIEGNYTDISMTKAEDESTQETYYQYRITITDMTRDVWFRVHEMNTNIDGYNFEAYVEGYWDDGSGVIDNFLNDYTPPENYEGQGDHDGKAFALQLTDDATVEFTNRYKVRVELPETGGPGIGQIKEFGWMLLLLAATMAGVEVQMNRRRRSGR